MRNVKLIEQIIAKLTATPTAYDQEVYGRPESDAPCGTAACIAGWAAHFAEPERATLGYLRELFWRSQYDSDVNVVDIATTALGLSAAESSVLFEGDPSEYWPTQFAEAWTEADGDRTVEARTAIDMLRYIAGGGELVDVEHGVDSDEYEGF